MDGKLIGLVSLRDSVRPESREVLDALRADGVRRMVLLTGDSPATAAAVAAELGIDEFRARVMPEGKQDVVKQLQAEGFVVAVVGDGTNGAPALALADIGITMGVSGTDVAVETADVALAADDLRALLDLRDLGAAHDQDDPAELRDVDRGQHRRTARLRQRRSPRWWPRSSTTPPPSPSSATAPASSATASPEAGA